MKLVHIEETAVTKARKALVMVGSGESLLFEGWIEYGEALLEIRRDYAADRDFGREIKRLGLDKYEVKHRDGSVEIKDITRMMRAAAEWAAGFPDEFKQARELFPERGSLRYLHQDWKEHNKVAEEPEESSTPQFMCISVDTHQPSEAPPPPVLSRVVHAPAPAPLPELAGIATIEELVVAIKKANPPPKAPPLETVTDEERKRRMSMRVNSEATKLISVLEDYETHAFRIKEFPDLWKKLCDLIDTYKFMIDYQNSLN
jgi:hypothetical protein